MTLIRIYCETSEEMCHLSGVEYSPDYLKALAELGIITLHNDYISTGELRKVKRLLRLKSMLGVNTAGAAIIIDLLDRIEALEAEVHTLKRR